MRRLALWSLIGLATCGAAPTAAHAQTGTPAKTAAEGQTLRELLDEVRQLRLALQRLTASGRQFQLLGERIRLQQGRVDALRRELEGARSQLAKTQAARAELAGRVKEAEEFVGRESQAGERAALEQVLREVKGKLSVLHEQEQQQRDVETQLNTQLQSEETKLLELNNRLDALERELSDLSSPK